MFGWLSCETVFASRSKRARISAVTIRCCGSSLIATSRERRGSRARYTSPMPPAPSHATISYGPIFVPAAIVMESAEGSASFRQIDQPDVGILPHAIEQDMAAVWRDVERVHRR